jgi:hypothetical protein
MFWDDLMRRWRRDQRVVGQNVLQAAGGHVAMMPSHRRRGRFHVPWWVVVALVAALAALLVFAETARTALL